MQRRFPVAGSVSLADLMDARAGSRGHIRSWPKGPLWSARCYGRSSLGWHGVHFGLAAMSCWRGAINAVLFPGLVAIYELSLLIRGERHPVAIKQIKAPGALFGAVVLWILVQNATWTPDWLHHPIWQMAADALDRPIDGSISVNRDLTSLALLRLDHGCKRLLDCLQLCRDACAGEFPPLVRCRDQLRLRCLRSFRLWLDAGAYSLV